MSVIKLSVRPLADLVYDETEVSELVIPKSNEENLVIEEEKTPVKKKRRSKTKTTSKGINSAPEQPSTNKQRRTKNKELLPGQKTIDKFFKSAGKNFKIEPAKEIYREKLKVTTGKKSKSRRKIIYDSETSVSSEGKFQMRKIKNKKPSAYIDLCLLESDEDEALNTNEQTTTTEFPANLDLKNRNNSEQLREGTSSKDADTAKLTDSGNPEEMVSLSEELIPPSPENQIMCSYKKNCTKVLWSEQRKLRNSAQQKHLNVSTQSDKSNKSSKSIHPTKKTNKKSQIVCQEQEITSTTTTMQNKNNSKTSPTLLLENDLATTSKIDKENLIPKQQTESFQALTIKEELIIDISDDDFETEAVIKNNININTRKTKSTMKTIEPKTKKPKRPPRPLPPYKIVEGTNFAVDAFCYGDISGVDHYFLTHFHSDHYIGLNQKFSNKIYMSSITASLVRTFIKIDEEYINELEINVPVKIDDVEVTAIDANHCPGAVMFIFKTSNGRCILHTGDFRANSEMESEPIFWNNDINTIYLDTTYISNKHSFCAQSESIDRAIKLIEEFNEKNAGSRKLFVCGTYLIGKEKFWSALACHFSYKVWAETNRKKALKAINNEEFNSLLTDNPLDAQIHILDMGKLNYDSLVNYLEKYEEHFDLIIGLRPSGWEKNKKPQFRGKVNIMGIEYSEHSSRDEMKRFVEYLKPQNVISTVPINSNNLTPKVPQIWYKYKNLKRTFEPSITSYFKLKPKSNNQINTTNNLSNIANTPGKSKSISKHNNELMIISPDVATTSNNNVDYSNCSVKDDEITKIQTELKLKQEVPAKVPIVENPIYIDDGTDDDWLTDQRIRRQGIFSCKLVKRTKL